MSAAESLVWVAVPGAVFLAYCASDVPSLFVRLIRRRSGGAR
ncbi:hypothetical protein [Streptomyces olivaceus]|nr:hypothetical protein [Streptomyces olivaceus]